MRLAMSSFSNIEEIEKLFVGLVDCLDFTGKGIDGSIGEDALDAVALGISERSRAEQDPGGENWAANRGEYKARKDRKGLPVGRGLKTPDGSSDVMLSIVNLKGRRSISATEAVMEFGAAGSTAAQKKGQWYTHGSTGSDGERSGAKNQPPRGFYAMTDADVDKVADIAGEGLGIFLKEHLS